MPEETDVAQPSPDRSGTLAPVELKQQSNRIATPGLVLAILVWPVGLVLSLIALVKSRSRGGAGRTPAVLGVVFSLILGVFTFAILGTLQKGTTAPDPGCTAAKAPALVIQDASVDSAKLQNAAAQIRAASGKAENPQLKVTLNAIYSDTLLYERQLQVASTSLVPAQQLQQNLNDLDQLCQFPNS